MNFTIRKAVQGDREAIEKLIGESVCGLSRDDYDARQIELSIQTVFGVDTELIADGTYFVGETQTGEMAGCGGWSKRKTLFGASRYSESRDSGLLDPKRDAAKIRAFFIHPDFARKGVGSLILEVCEREAEAHGFKRAEMMATLPGVKLYAARGYTGDEQVSVPVGENVAIICVKMRKLLA
ncbi:MAG TPA: GNAT family N-acetyltransferase [Pyrinomonadaceae bacterium]|jgi:N-acetylglutamate synthase-like GNAT family acetyltransferase